MCLDGMAVTLRRRFFSISIVHGLISGLGLALLLVAQARAQDGVNAEVQAAFRAGSAAAVNNDFKTAETEFEKVVRLAPELAQGHSALGTVLFREGKLPQAIAALEKAVELKPGDIATSTNLALAYEQTRAYKKALTLFKSVEAEAEGKPASDPEHTLPSYFFSGYARSLAATGQPAAAVSKMKSAVTGSPQNAELHDDLGSLYAQQQNWTVGG